MKQFLMFLGAVSALFTLCGANATADGGKKLSVEAKLASPYISAVGGRTFLHLTVIAPDVSRAERKPVNVCVVLDRSGSMGSERKMDFAKQALYTLIDQLREEDLLSLVIYDDVVDILRESGRVFNKRELKRLVSEITPRGSTNLGGGMIEGLQQVQQTFKRGFVNRVVLLSDGLANAGITDPHELGRVAAQYRARSISLTTMGVGLEYNENLMTGLAESGGGNYYFIESPRSLASIVRKEFDMLTTLCANNVEIELRLGKGVALKDVIGYEWKNERDACRISLGDLYGSEQREIAIELEAPKGTGSIALADGSVFYEGVGEVEKASPTFAANALYTADEKLIEKKRDLSVQSKVDVAVSTRAVQEATKAMDAGNYKQAEDMMEQAAAHLSASPAASGAGAASMDVQRQVGELNQYKQMLKDSAGDYNYTRAKKAIQYKNYQTQKSKK
jgi:Ca-activated chloride channel family protein